MENKTPEKIENGIPKTKMSIQEEWDKKIAESNDTMFKIPEAMKGEETEFQAKFDEYLNKAKEFDRLSADFDVFTKNFWHNMRKELEKEGTQDIWGKNIGFNKEAKKDGIKVVNLTQAAPQGMQMR